MFAGNTQINNTMIPHEPRVLVLLKRINTPNNTSKKPLMSTHSLCRGIIGGMIAIKKSGFIKCLTPIIIYSILKV